MAKRLILLFLLMQTVLLSQQMNIPLLKNIAVSGSILELQLTSSTSEQVLLGWQNSNGQQETHAAFLRPGTSTLDLSNYRTWKGNIVFLVTNNPRIQAKLSPLTIGHSLSSFFQPQYLTPRSINMLEHFKFKNVNANMLMLGLWLLFFIGTLLFKVNWQKGLFVSFVLVWTLQSMRMMKNEADIFSKLKTDNYELAPFVEIAAFVKEAKPLINGNRWSKDQLSGVLNSYVKYQLWEEPFVPRKQAQTNDYLITTTPKQRQVVFQKNGFYLVQL